MKLITLLIGFFCFFVTINAQASDVPLKVGYYYDHFEDALASVVGVVELTEKCIEQFPQHCKKSPVFDRDITIKRYQGLPSFESIIKNETRYYADKNYGTYDELVFVINKEFENVTTKTLSYELEFFARYLAAAAICGGKEKFAEIGNLKESDLRSFWKLNDKIYLQLDSAILKRQAVYQDIFSQPDYFSACRNILSYGDELSLALDPRFRSVDNQKGSLLGYVFGVAVILDTELQKKLEK